MSNPALLPRFFALSESRDLAVAVARDAGLEVSSPEERRYEGGEFKLRPLESVRGRTAFVLQSLAGTQDVPVAERFLRLLFLLNGLRDAGANQRVALVPYLAFARKDRRTQLRDPVNTRYVAQLLEASGIDRVITLDVHNPAALRQTHGHFTLRLSTGGDCIHRIQHQLSAARHLRCFGGNRSPKGLGAAI